MEPLCWTHESGLPTTVADYTHTPIAMSFTLRRILGAAFVLAAMLFPTLASAQGTGTVTGTVTDDQGEPVLLVNVTLPELNRGAATDIDGTYTLTDIPAGTYAIRATYIGFEPSQSVVTVSAGSTTTVDFSLTPQILENVIVEGYRVRRAPVETGATSLVGADEIETLTVRSADAALQGRAAGVRATSLSGQPGAGIQVRVRGSGSITAGNDPLYIIDGVQISNDNEINLASGNPLASINPQEIESIEVLKDASATSIYGAQAANGVVIVTTKRGRRGPTEFTFSSQLGSVSQIADFRVLSAEEFLQNRFQGYVNGLQEYGFSEQAAIADAIRRTVPTGGRGEDTNGDGVLDRFIPENRVFGDFNGDGTVGADEFRVVDTNWQDQVFRSGMTQQYSLSARGGNDKTRFFALGRFADDQGQVIASEFKQYALRLNLDHTASDLLSFESSVNLSNSNYRGTIGNGAFINSPYWAAQFIPPTVSVYNTPDDEGSGFNLRPNATFSYNPVAQETFDTRVADVVRIIGNVAANVTLPYNFLARSYAGVNFGDVQEEDYRDGRQPQNRGLGEGGVNGRLSVLASRTTEFNLSQSLQWSKLFDSVHGLDALGVVEYRRGFEDDFNTRGIGFPSSLFRTLASSAEAEIANSSKTEFRFLSFVGNTEYTYDNTYQLAATLRYDGSSRFGIENRFGLFGALGGYVRLSNLGPLKGSRFVNDLKLRGSYGTTGNSNIGNFAALQLFSGAGEYGGQPGISPTQLANTILTWEELAEANIGLDYSLFTSRVYGAVELYNRDSNELLLNRELPVDSGFGSITENVGTIRQQGLEFAINTVNVNSGLFRWTSTFNIAAQRAEVKSLTDGDDEITFNGGRSVYRVGEAPNQIRLVEYAGVNPANGRPMYYDADRNLTYDPNSVPLDDRPLLGNDNPDFFGGFGNTFGVGPVSLDIFFQYDFGRTTWNNNAYFGDTEGFDGFNRSYRVLDRWQAPGDVVVIPKAQPFTYPDGVGATSSFVTSRFLEDASYIRLKQLALSFQVPPRYLGAVRNARIYVQGENLVTFTKFSDTDPELVGTALGQYPQSRRIIGGLSIGL